MRIQHNIMAMGAYRNYTNNVNAMRKNLEKLSSGYKINRAGDDAAGLAISEKMRAQITGLETAQKNAKDGISLVQTAEGALTEVHDMLNRMVTLATQSANGTYDNDVDRVQLQKELDQLRTEINRIADSANFNGIKLFDGSLSSEDLTVDGTKTSQVDYAAGINAVTGEGGGGTKGEFSFTVDTLFGADDKIEIALSAGGPVTLTFGTNFKGDTVEDQAKSIADALSGNTTLAPDFDVTVDGNKVTITSKYEGTTKADGTTAAPTIKSIKATDKATTKDTTNWKATAGDDATATGKASFKKLFDGATGTTGSLDVGAGDTLTFEFTVGAKKYTAKLDVTDAMINNDLAKTTENIAEALKNVRFEDSADTTGSDESLLKVGDLFDITTNATTSGDIEFEGKGAAKAIAIAGAKVQNSRGGNAVTSAAGTAGVAGTNAAKYEVALDTTNGASNFSVGDKLNFTGVLSDGRTFDITLEAGKDFAIATGATAYQDTLTNIKNALTTGKDQSGNDISVTVKGGGKEVQANSKDIFDATKGDFTVTSDATKLTLTSNTKGLDGDPGVASVTNVGLDAAAAASITDELNPAEKQTQATSTITFSDGMKYGSTITVGGNTYELVKSKDDLSSQKNIAVEVSDLSDVNDVAKKMAKAINDNPEKDAKGAVLYTAAAKDNVVTITTAGKGSAIESPTVAAAKDLSTELSFTLNPDKVQAGSYVTINGQDYQFVADRADAEAGKTAVVVDFKKPTAQTLGQALVDVASGKNNANVSMDENGKITVRSINEVDGELPVPTASFHNGTGGLTLQIGDTADDYNKMKVSIYKMKTWDMGIGDISILDQDSAGAAIDKIRSAINYVSDVRGTLGATQNRLDHTINNLSVMQENIQDAESTIRDTDVAAEMMAYTKNNILIQSAQAMLAQANQVPQGVLQLLQ